MIRIVQEGNGLLKRIADCMISHSTAFANLVATALRRMQPPMRLYATHYLYIAQMNSFIEHMGF